MTGGGLPVASDTPNPWTTLVAARISCGGDRGVTLAQLRKDLGPWLPEGRAPEQDAALQPPLEALVVSGQAEPGGAKTPKWMITPAGKKALAGTLGIPAQAPWPTWAKMRNLYLTAYALGQPASNETEQKRIQTVTGLRGAILKAEAELPTVPLPTAKQAVDAYLWRQIGRETDAQFTISAVKQYLLQRALEQPNSTLKVSQLEALVPARLVGARRTDANALRQAAIAAWTQAAPPAEPPPEPETDLARFAGDVHAAARESSTGWFGDTLLFISHLYFTYREHTGRQHLTLDAFKERLVEAHRADLLTLVRADYVEAMPPADVHASRTTYLTGVFHFLRVVQGG